MPSKTIIFCGKGGVGRTTIGLAMALKHAARGKRVLVVTSHPLPELAMAVSLEGLGTHYPAAVKNLFIVHLDPVELLRDVVNRNFPVTAADDATVRSAIFRNLVEVAPGLKSFYFLARLQELAQRQAEGTDAPQYELLIWDSPPSREFLSTLRSARAFEHPNHGPLVTAGADVARFFSTNGNVVVIPVTTLEGETVGEMSRMTATLGNEFGWKSSILVFNLVGPLASERESAELLGRKLQTPAAVVPRLLRTGPDLAMLGEIAGMVDVPVGA